MTDMSNIKQHMEVIGADGIHDPLAQIEISRATDACFPDAR
jgi:hypothetical protein